MGLCKHGNNPEDCPHCQDKLLLLDRIERVEERIKELEKERLR